MRNNAEYGLSLRFVHPSIDPKDITKKLKIKPRFSWKSGEQAKSPTGTKLNFVRKESYWCYNIKKNDEFFSSEINKILKDISQHRGFLHRIVAENGRVELYLGLPGSINIGDTIPLETLTKLTDLKVALAIEVFPHMKKIANVAKASRKRQRSKR